MYYIRITEERGLCILRGKWDFIWVSVTECIRARKIAYQLRAVRGDGGFIIMAGCHRLKPLTPR